ncbi:MAG: right-handed parallel beta-helix repeat-containing protein [Prevotellaceae bacterium]|nr:right-handed parallel beta-helix repeat-containing protein [Prevotellaceae bacterium]
MSLYSQNQSDTIVVDRNGRGDYRNISDAIESIRAFDPEHIVTVYIRDGYYKEKLTVPTWLNRVNFVGESAEHTIINYDDHANIALPDGKGGKTGTFRTYTLLVQGNDITFENMSIENSALQLGQAVAMHVEGDRIVLRNCKLIGNQDTFYAGRENCRIYLENCYIEGTTDFIFGASTCWFEKCEIFCKKNSFITAASTPQNTAYGLIFNNCTIRTAEHVDKLYLGRPWRPFAMTVFMNCQLPAAIVPEGWDNWRNTENEKTARYFEYNNSGDGANNSQRANWTTILTKTQAEEITLENVFKDWKIN